MRLVIIWIALFFYLGGYAQNKTVALKTDSNAKTVSVNGKFDSVKTSADNIYINLPGDEKSWWSDWLPFFATIIVAYAAYRGVIKQSKASSISGFRVNWIEDLRINYSKFLIALRNVDDKIRNGQLGIQQFSKDEDVENLNFLKTKIKLMLNHSETEHIEFWEALTTYMQEHNEYYKGPFSEDKENELDQRRVVMEGFLLKIFKKEWQKAKNFG